MHTHAHNIIINITNYKSKSKQINNNGIAYSYYNYLFVNVNLLCCTINNKIILRYDGVSTEDLHFKVRQKTPIHCDCAIPINLTSNTMAKNTFKLFKLQCAYCFF